MRISDWSSDVCSSDLLGAEHDRFRAHRHDSDFGVTGRRALLAAAAAGGQEKRQGRGDLFHGECPQRELIVSERSLLIRALFIAPKHRLQAGGSEERRVGKGCASTWSFRWWPNDKKK